MSQPIVILIHIRRISRFPDSILSSKRVHLGRLSSERNYGSECRDLDIRRIVILLLHAAHPNSDPRSQMAILVHIAAYLSICFSFSPFHQIGPATKNLFSPVPSEYRSWTYRNHSEKGPSNLRFFCDFWIF